MARVRANEGPTDETFLQCGQRASALLRILNRNVSLQCAQVTRLVPGGRMVTETLTGPRLMIRLQFGRGQAIRCEEALHIKRQLQGHRTYFLPGGAAFMGVASLHTLHLTTC